eukprot:CAMPEP_0197317738 /NCGR_PEP_ID=MMETSP0891-20130614/48297_1 /TAXON_ID=44058 ORGANISM="Aureoumbra lagunensis, Strain CCMP1510" /NCGR_SAMPLE_ID=MMETSP0891 /ASSEMBLY_ACC=CAM_ASM_000534 /LENGTH=504 /DNA_ID=CAMNT_0042807877 /DNA_START=242 /DNA_END=1756 /DNA_ORIENTATION=+
MYKLPSQCYDGLLTGLARRGDARGCESIIRDMERAGIERSEASYSALVQAHVENNELEKAKRVVESLRLAENIEPRLRTFAPLVRAFCIKNRPLEARSFVRSMVLEHGIIPTGDLFAQLLVALAHAMHQHASKQIDSLLFDEFRSTLRELELYTDGLECSDDLDAIYHAIQFKGKSQRYLQARFVQLDQTTGACPWNVEIQKLQPPRLDAHDRRVFRDRLMDVTAAASARQFDQLAKFDFWLRENKHKNFSIIIDGPNVAYHNQNFQGGGFNIQQLVLVVHELERLGHRPLIIMPSKYCEPVIPNHAKQSNTTTHTEFLNKDDDDDEDSLASIPTEYVSVMNPIGNKNKRFRPVAMQNLSLAELNILREWSANGILYSVPRGCHDDSYWMLATVTGSNPPLALTNDKIRDHWHKLLGARSKDRWSTASVVHFEIDLDRDCNQSTIKFDFPPPYVRHVHRNFIDLRDISSSATVWHIPDMSPNATRWLAIRLNGDTNSDFQNNEK